MMRPDEVKALDQTLRATDDWLDEVVWRIGPDRDFAWRVLSAVLQVLRDRLPANLGASLAAQFPVLIRGTYYDGYSPERLCSGYYTAEEFVAEVSARIGGVRAGRTKDWVYAVFELLSCRIAEGQITQVRQALPKSIRELWALPAEVRPLRGSAGQVAVAL